MKYNPVLKDPSGTIRSYVRYDPVKDRYLLVGDEELTSVIELIFDMEVIPSEYIPVGLESDPLPKNTPVLALPVSSFYSKIFSGCHGSHLQGLGLTLNKNALGMVQIQLLQRSEDIDTYSLTAFVNPDCLMEDDAYIPVMVSTNLAELRRVMATNPINL